ncbi:MAG TPA: PEP-CTERM sorting domain-containing protein [Verrucomicrobiales bacterium]|jgi:hypothetical protein|nr:PEP-CTERM sorting domain-containing protein [Verrucomicrobiales bacterium]
MKLFLRLWFPLLPFLLPVPESRAAVAVGASSLIGTLDYSDGFTFGTGGSGTRNGTAYTAGAFPITTAPLLQLENSYSNPVRSWSPSLWSLNNDANFLNGNLNYPGGSGGGSVSGFTQTGNALDYGIEYDLRNRFVVQFDAVQTADRVDITATNVRNGIAGANGISIFFRTNGFTNLGNSAEIGIYNPSIGEVLVPFDTGSASVDLGEWHNYAVSFDLTALQIGVYVDQISLGTIDLNTFGGTKFGGGVVAPGAFAGVVSAATNDAVSVGASGNNRVWTDNFQVGAMVPEPGAAALSLASAGILLRRRRKA